MDRIKTAQEPGVFIDKSEEVKKEQVYKVGADIYIRRCWMEGREYLTFDGNPHAKDFPKIWLAMFAITKYLKWWTESINIARKPEIRYSEDRRQLFIDGWEVMRLKEGNRVSRASISKYHLQALMGWALEGQLDELISKEIMSVFELVRVEKICPNIKLRQEDGQRLEDAFVQWITEKELLPGKHELDFAEFCSKVRIDGNLIADYLLEKLDGMSFDGSFISAFYCNGKKIFITIV